MSAPGTLHRHTWRWFTTRLFGLSSGSRTWLKLGEKRRTQVEDAEGGSVTDWE